VQRDCVPEGWKRGNVWSFEVVRSETAPVGSGVRHVVRLWCEEGARRSAELTFEGEKLALARVEVLRDPEGVLAASARWLKGDLAFDEPEGRTLAFPLDWPSWGAGTTRTAVEGRGERSQTIAADAKGWRVELAALVDGKAERPVVQDWARGAPWWSRSRSAWIRGVLLPAQPGK
jgi:hypothetical protein